MGVLSIDFISVDIALSCVNILCWVTTVNHPSSILVVAIETFVLREETIT